MSGTTSPLTPEEFEGSGQVLASEAEMRQILEMTPRKQQPTFEEGMCSHMWTMEEELVDEASQHSSDLPGLHAALRSFFMAVAVLSIMLTMKGMLRRAYGEQAANDKASPKTVEVGRIYAV